MIILNQFHYKIKIFDFYFIVSIIVNINNKVITTNKGIKNTHRSKYIYSFI